MHYSPKLILSLLALGSSLTIAAPASGQSRQETTPSVWLARQAVTSNIGRTSPKQLRDFLLSRFQHFDIDNNGFSPDDNVLHEQLGRARSRPHEIARWLRFDLDGNGIVDRVEIELTTRVELRRSVKHDNWAITPSEQQIADNVEQTWRKAKELDLDDDGSLTLPEVTKAIDAIAKRGRTLDPSLPMSFDANTDGKVTSQEFLIAVDQFLSEADSNHDGKITHDEIMVLLTPQLSTQPGKTGPATDGKCRFPPPQPSDQVVFGLVWAGAALTNLGIGQEMLETSAVQVEIEKGDRPLYVVLTSAENIIWQFSGSLDRVARVVVVANSRSNEALAGVVGIPRDRLSIIGNKNCSQKLDFYDATMSVRARSALARLTGRNADQFVVAHRAAKLMFPAGYVLDKSKYAGSRNTELERAGSKAWKKLLLRKPGGVVQITPESVVSDTRIRQLPVLPAEAGLAQLVGEGALSEDGGKTIIETPEGSIIDADTGTGANIDISPASGALVRQSPLTYRILKPMHVPRGLESTRAVMFVLSRGVPKPEGDLGSSCVFVEETGEVLGREC